MSCPACPEQPGVALHLVQRGLGRAACFFRVRDGFAYLHWLRECAERFECAVHAYVLMRNHVHLLLTPARAGCGSRLMRALGERYARHFAEAHGRAGPLWEEPFDASPVYASRYVLSCMRYIEDNPVRAGLVADPAAYRWSSYGANAWGRDDPLVTPHALYYALGRTPEWRRARYRAMCWRVPPVPRAPG
ncbi:MAG: transposase [Betaproteobacteria bacterium]|nr:transposase [Betaproteobacteria bacterium]